MRNALDLIEGALIGLGDFVDLPRLFDGARNDCPVAPKLKLGDIRRVCKALKECTRIVNSEEYNLENIHRGGKNAVER